MNDVIKLRRWCVTQMENDPYVAPECRGNPALIGLITDHPVLIVKQGGDTVRTSRIKKINKRTIETDSGRKYRLMGDPDQKFKDFLASEDLPYIPGNPMFPLIENDFIHIKE